MSGKWEQSAERAEADIERVLTYHALSTHRLDGYAPSPGFLDWDCQPDPFRRFAGARAIPLPLAKESCGRAYESLFGGPRDAPSVPGLKTLGRFLELSFGLSAWKSIGPDRWALRNAPSSGNLHPCEAYLMSWAETEGEIEPGVYHYDVYQHALELRCPFDGKTARAFRAACPNSFAALGLASVSWREEWKYGARAFRYCQLDAGHALGAARFAAATLDWDIRLATTIGDGQVADLLGLSRADDFAGAEREHPGFLCLLGRAPRAHADWDDMCAALENRPWCGQANILSAERVNWPQIQDLLPVVRKPASENVGDASPPPQEVAPPMTQAPDEGSDAASVIRARRSAQRMDKETSRMTRDEFFTMLEHTLAVRDRIPFDAFPYAPAVSLVLFIHAVDGLDPGLYLLARAPEHVDTLRARMSAEFSWRPVDAGGLPLYALNTPRDVRKVASQLSCHQAIAGHGAFAVSMLADIAVTLEALGPWAYRRLHWEAGLIGHILYLEAQSRDLSGTGIGCFFDEAVTALLGLKGDGWTPLYHFTVGKARADDRIQTEPAYAHLAARRSHEGGTP